MTKNLYISDLDFTLLKSDKTLSNFTRSAINKFYEKNVLFTVATARSIYSLKPLLGEVPLHIPVVEFNGGYITNYANDKPLIHFPLPKQLVQSMVELANEHDLSPLISAYGSDGQLVFPPLFMNGGFQLYFDERKESNDPRLRPRSELPEIFVHDIMALAFIGRKEQLDPLQIAIESKYGNQIDTHYYENKYTPGWWWFSIHDKQSRKDVAISKLRDLYDFNNHKLIVFGDDVNDISMFEAADVAIAVSNAKPEVKEVADHVISSNDDDAVVKYILKHEGLD